MKTPCHISLLSLVLIAVLSAEEAAKNDNRAKHQEGSALVADEQDELSADVQQLVIEQTVPKVIELLGEVEEIMDEATERLGDADTGVDTMAAQTEIIEKIHAAAKEKQGQEGSGGKSGSAMMDMMERMMGKKPGEEKKPGQPGKDGPASDSGSNGMTGGSDSGNEAAGGSDTGKSEARRVPKSAGAASAEIPEEFKKAFDAYNRGAEKKVK